MRLADYIADSSEVILAEWVSFAATCSPAAQTMNRVDLRDHASAMLRTIVTDLRTPETAAEQAEKSRGHAEPHPDGEETPAEIHGAARAESGFTVGETVSEFRALRASVIRLWTKTIGSLTGADLDDLIRFNETIDQALAESITRYTEDLDRSKEMFVAILGHDLRTPLGVISMSSQHMLAAGVLGEPYRSLAGRIARSSARMSDMVADLLDFTRSRLGAGIPVGRASMDMGTVVCQAVDEMAAAHPESSLHCTVSGDLRGSWDSGRIAQLMANLLGNAVQHGSAETPITVTAQGEAGEVVLRVHNHGPAIPSSELHDVFSPLKRLKSGEEAPRDPSNLGLGLYIAERIAIAHGGSISVSSSSEAGTAFTVRLPREGAGV
ncbi:MAG TPA: sensor histidine kinase [Gemmatimonadaceae bacterium]|nr:sensor histidine kinase [Gemmatimonadaceae bacterium]